MHHLFTWTMLLIIASACGPTAIYRSNARALSSVTKSAAVKADNTTTTTTTRLQVNANTSPFDQIMARSNPYVAPIMAKIFAPLQLKSTEDVRLHNLGIDGIEIITALAFIKMLGRPNPLLNRIHFKNPRERALSATQVETVMNAFDGAQKKSVPMKALGQRQFVLVTDTVSSMRAIILDHQATGQPKLTETVNRLFKQANLAPQTEITRFNVQTMHAQDVRQVMNQMVADRKVVRLAYSRTFTGRIAGATLPLLTVLFVAGDLAWGWEANHYEDYLD